MTQRSPLTCDDPLILAIDVGSSSVRAILFDRQAQPLRGLDSRANYEFQITADGGVEVSADQLLERVVSAIDQVVSRANQKSQQIAGVAVSTFWHNVLGVDSEGRAVTPVYSWADTRSASAAQELKRNLDESKVHARTGCVFHPSYLPAKLLWLSRAQPETFRTVERWMSIGEYLYLRLFGHTLCSISMASGTGLLNQNRCEWDQDLIRALPIRPEQLSPLGDLESPLHGLKAPFSQRWPVLTEIPWFPALGDGACSNIGSGCSTRNRVAIMVGTSGAMRVLWEAQQVEIPPGLWCYHASRQRFVMGGALSNGGLLFDWMTETLRVGDDRDTIERQLSQMEADAHGLTVLPFLAGERSTGWNANARAAIVGLTLHHRPIDIVRASMEAVAYRFAKIARLLRRVVADEFEIVASGGALLKSPCWTQMMADVLGRSVIASRVNEASSRGAALLALEALGMIHNLENFPAPLGEEFSPKMERHQRYQSAIQRQDALYDLLIK